MRRAVLGARAIPASTANPSSRWRAGAWAEASIKEAVTGLAKALHAGFIVFACFALLDPSPYDIVAIPTMLLWLALGLPLYHGAFPLVALLLLYIAAMTISLIPYLDEPAPVLWTVQLAYPVATGIFAMLFSVDAPARMETALKTYAASCVFSAVLGIVGYFLVLGVEDLIYKYGRASGTVQDPNVFGSYLVLGALYLPNKLLRGATRFPIAYAVAC